MKTNSICLIFFLFVIILFPSIMAACPLCQGGAKKDTDFAYKGITLFLALLPILWAFAIFYWIKIKSKSIKNKETQNII